MFSSMLLTASPAYSMSIALLVLEKLGEVSLLM